VVTSIPKSEIHRVQLALHQEMTVLPSKALQINLCLRNDLYCVGWGVKLYSLTLTNQSMSSKPLVTGFKITAIFCTAKNYP